MSASDDPDGRRPVLTATVLGQPVPQGSIRSLGAGRPSVHSNAKVLKPWRDSVKDELHNARTDSAQFPLTGPVAIELVFTVRKPKSAPKRRRTWPTARPDIDKLARAILDAATFAGVIGDDSQVVELAAVKVFPLEHPDALDVPGVRIVVRQVLDVDALAELVTVAEDGGIPW